MDDNSVQEEGPVEAADELNEEAAVEEPLSEEAAERTLELGPTLESEAAANEGDLAESTPLSEMFPLAARLGSILFVSPKPMTVDTLAYITKAPVNEVEEALAELALTFDPLRCGFSLCEVAGAWQLRTAPGLAKIVHALIPPKARKLSRAAAETLAVVAYKQPVQRAEIEAIRGVDALPTLKTLLEARLIRVVGTEESVGRPALYGTTQVFLEKFGLRDLSDLPPIRELLQVEADLGEGEEMSAAEESESAGAEVDDLGERSEEALLQ